MLRSAAASAFNVGSKLAISVVFLLSYRRIASDAQNGLVNDSNDSLIPLNPERPTSESGRESPDANGKVRPEVVDREGQLCGTGRAIAPNY
jgi:hypothetical protein